MYQFESHIEDSIKIGEQNEIEVVVMGVRRSCVLLGIRAPKEILIERDEKMHPYKIDVGINKR